ncbi:MAG: hypothetical protein D4R97_07905 [Bacteroidetes bacterium]|nr:MAG: hypothetical protein D4R97_07905 [Bacteroidota bacterium]
MSRIVKAVKNAQYWAEIVKPLTSGTKKLHFSSIPTVKIFLFLCTFAYRLQGANRFINGFASINDRVTDSEINCFRNGFFRWIKRRLRMCFRGHHRHYFAHPPFDTIIKLTRATAKGGQVHVIRIDFLTVAVSLHF